MNTQLNKRKYIIFLLIFLIILSGVLVSLLSLNKKEDVKNEILINTNNMEKIIDNKYNLYNKIDYLEGEVITKFEVTKLSLNIKSGDFVILNKELMPSKKWKLDDLSLIVGSNEICIEALLNNNETLKKCIIVNNYDQLNLGKLDTYDTDNDGLKNYEELFLGTKVDIEDTDGDSLNDYEELYYTFTDPLKSDSNDNGVLDFEEDYDNDGLSSKNELYYNTSLDSKDTDEDGLTDYDEIYLHNTLPNNIDTDSDGLTDYDEIMIYFTDPKVIDSKISFSKTSDDGIAMVEFNNLDSKHYNTVKIDKSNNNLFMDTIPGYIIDAYEFNIDSDKIPADEVKISFQIPAVEFSEDFNPKIYYYNDETQILEELETTIENGRAYTTVKHFSTYVLIDKTSHDAIWDSDSGKIVDNTQKDLDVVFVIDISMSMDENDPSDSRKQIMSNFIASLDENDRVGVVLFRKTSQVLNNGFAQSIRDKNILITDVFNISNDNGKTTSSGTNGSLGLYTAIKMFDNQRNAQRYIIFLTDGEDTVKSYSYENIYKWANEKNIKILTIGLGEGIDADTLKNISEKTDGNYYYVDDSNELNESYVGILENTNEYRTDSNSDGISDYFTKLICDGKLTTTTGINPFGSLSYEEIQKNSDYDKDGVSNGEEVEITVLDEKIYLKYISSPVIADTDEDGLGDNKDASPLVKFDSKFSVVDSLNYVPPTPTIDKFEKASDEVYNTETGDYGSSKTRAKIMVGVFGNMPAALALDWFLDNHGKTYNFDNDWGLLNTYRGKENLAKNTNSLLQVVEESVKSGDTITFATNKELRGTNFSEKLEDLADIGWWYAVGYTSATMVGQATNNNGYYTMTLYYNIVDYYDWDKDANFISGFGGLVNDAEMYELHALGEARQYRVDINYKMEITWKAGDRYYLNKYKLWETPETMVIKKIK